MVRRPECFTDCLVQCFVDENLISIEGQLPAARQAVKDLADERLVAESLYLGSMDDADTWDREQLGRQYAVFDRQQQELEVPTERNVSEMDATANQLVELGEVAVRGCSGPTEKGLCTGPVQEGFYLESMTTYKKPNV